MRVHILRWSLILTMCCATSGCGILRPPQQVVETKFVIIHPGAPIQVLAGAKKVTGRTLNEPQEVAEGLDLSGWVAMPTEHYEKVKTVLDWYAKYRAGLIEKQPEAPK